MINLVDINKYGLIFFRLGVFLLPSAPVIAVFFFILSISISFFKNKLKLFSDKRDYLFLVAASLMLLISFIHYFDFEDVNFIFRIWDQVLEVEELKIISSPSYSSFIGLSNWIPLFLCFFGFQPYLKTSQDREVILKLLLAGSVPVLISGFGQIWFDWHKPMEFLNGLIIWFQKPNRTFSGLFNNQNYAGCWLNIVWPFSIAIFYEKTKNILRKGSSLIFLISIFIASFLTFSRNAWGGLFLAIPLVLGPATLYWIVIFILISIALIYLKTTNFLPENVNEIINTLLPAKFNILQTVLDQFSSSSYPNPANSRKTIFFITSQMILTKPFIGWGAATFPIYYGLRTSIYMSHAHNLILDTAFNYGLLVSILIFSNIFFICFLTFKKIFFININKFSDNYFERAWWTSFFVLFCSQMFDVQYYDLRISIAFWLLLAGLRCIIEKNPDNTTYTNQQTSLYPHQS